MENRGVESYEVLKQALSGPVGVKQLAAEVRGLGIDLSKAKKVGVVAQLLSMT